MTNDDVKTIILQWNEACRDYHGMQSKLLTETSEFSKLVGEYLTKIDCEKFESENSTITIKQNGTYIVHTEWTRQCLDEVRKEFVDKISTIIENIKMVIKEYW